MNCYTLCILLTILCCYEVQSSQQQLIGNRSDHFVRSKYGISSCCISCARCCYKCYKSCGCFCDTVFNVCVDCCDHCEESCAAARTSCLQECYECYDVMADGYREHIEPMCKNYVKPAVDLVGVCVGDASSSCWKHRRLACLCCVFSWLIHTPAATTFSNPKEVSNSSSLKKTN